MDGGCEGRDECSTKQNVKITLVVAARLGQLLDQCASGLCSPALSSWQQPLRAGSRLQLHSSWQSQPAVYRDLQSQRKAQASIVTLCHSRPNQASTGQEKLKKSRYMCIMI